MLLGVVPAFIVQVIAALPVVAVCRKRKSSFVYIHTLVCLGCLAALVAMGLATNEWHGFMAWAVAGYCAVLCIPLLVWVVIDQYSNVVRGGSDGIT